MNRVRLAARVSAAVLFALSLLVGGCATPQLELTPEDPDGERLARLVDSDEAHALLVELLSAAPARYANPAPTPFGTPTPTASPVPPGLLGTVSTRDGASAAALPAQSELHSIGVDVSMDFAALTFAEALRADEKSQPVQTVFEAALNDDVRVSEALLRQPGGFPYTMLFAPGWLWESHPKTGADFSYQREELDRLGLPHRLIETNQSGSIEENAGVIAKAVREARVNEETVILVSASKAGADTAYALTKLLAPDEVAHVAAWVNAGGALRGTPLADIGMRAPVSWIVRPYFAVAGWSLDGVRSMQPARTGSLLEGARMPESIAVINLVAIPMSGTVGRTIRGGYWVMRRRGPTDGVVPLAESIWPGGFNIPVLGSDHLLIDFREREKGLALLRAIDFAVRRHSVGNAHER